MLKELLMRFSTIPLLTVFWLILFTIPGFTLINLCNEDTKEESTVKVWEEATTIPTYLTGEPDPNPMFYLGRAYQGAEGRVYPYPLYDKLAGIKVDKTYNIVYLENEFIQVGIAPEMGGRIFSARDKTNNYDFIYHQHVIKPALIGMLGAWISGGLELNIPHHHRPTSFLPVQYRIEYNEDGSKTVWVGEMELRHRLRWAIGYTLKPGKSYIEMTTRIVNRTSFVQTVLCFTNTAVHANENYQVLFPPSTNFVTHHAKIEFTTWPIATTQYGNADFSDSVNVSWYKNHFEANSMFAWNYNDDFVGGYDHGLEAGIICVANHHIVPGKKFWTWGNSPYGKMWDNILTDEDGPYIELMVGAYSDNQPDYSWIQPYEVKNFKQYWYPVRDIGGVKKANINGAVNLDINKNGIATVGFYLTSMHPEAIVQLKSSDKVILQEKVAIDPGKPFKREVKLPNGIKKEDIRASVMTNGIEVISYSPVLLNSESMPESVVPPLPPDKIKTNEELYLIGRRIEQFHNPALEADPYWEEALRRDPGDSRVNTALGITCLKKGMFRNAEKYFRKALKRLTANYTIPKEGETYYYLGQSLKRQNRMGEAYDMFYKAIWSDAWKSAGYYSLAEIDCQRGDLTAALKHLNHSLVSNTLNTKALNLKAAVLRHIGQSEKALESVSAVRMIDPVDIRAVAEHWLVDKDAESVEELLTVFRNFPETALETAIEFSNAGLWQDCMTILFKMIEAVPDSNNISPLVYYYLGYFADNLGQNQKASAYYSLAERMPPDFVFPFQLETIVILQQVIKTNPNDARALYYLGNLLFDWQPEEAIRLWEKSRSLDVSFSILHRNLAVAYFSYENDLNKAIKSLEVAVSLDRKYAIHFFELDKLYQAAGISPEKRLAMLEKNHKIVELRDDALSREIYLKVYLGKYDQAINLMKSRQFNIWEGGARFSVSGYWTEGDLLRGHQYFAEELYSKALAEYKEALIFPENLRTSRTERDSRKPETDYWIGNVYEALGDHKRALTFWEKSSSETVVPESDYLLPVSDKSVIFYYQALSLQELEQKDKAEAIFNKLIISGKHALEEDAQIDFFAKFGQQQTRRSRSAMAHYLVGLGHYGLKEKEKARQEFYKALEISPDYLGAKNMLAGMN